MKKWIKRCLIVICVLIALDFLAQLFCLRINPMLVDRMELYTYVQHIDGSSVEDEEHHVELTRKEIWKISMLYNLSFPNDTVMADPPPMYDRLVVHFKTGTKMTLYVYVDEQFLLKPGHYVISNQRLYDYIQELLEKYDLPVW